ncbi:MAG: DNA polymerase III subunit delta [Syntrophomonadaceae bacterium]|jgi:DNA polymerase-3 subunit delta
MEKKIIYIWGQELFLVEKEVERIIDAIGKETQGKPEVVFLDADAMSPAELLEFLQFSPLFSLYRIIVIKRPSWLGKNRPNKKNLTEIETVIKKYTEWDIQGQTLIITSDQPYATSPIVKLIEKKGTIIKCDPLGTRELTKWVREEFAKRDCKIKPGVDKILVDSRQDMYFIFNTIEKLSLMVKDRPISQGDVTEQLSVREEAKVFGMTDALLRKETNQALQALNKLLSQGESPILLVSVMARQFINLARVKYFQERGLSNRETAAQTGLPGFVVGKIMERASVFSWEQIENAFELFLNTDMVLKTTGQDERIVLETLVVELCH